MHSIEFYEKAVSIASKEFIRGFIIGQVALLIILVVLARLLFFRSPNARQVLTFKKIGRTKQQLHPSSSPVIGDSSNVAGQSETCEWINRIIRKVLMSKIREQLELENFANTLTGLINDKISSKDIVGPLHITQLEMGFEDPVIERIESTFDKDSFITFVAWNDPATFKVETSVNLNWPPNNPVACLPCSFSFIIHSLRVSLKVNFSTDNQKLLILAILPDDFLLDVELHSLIGHRSKLKDVPKLTTLLHGKIHTAIRENLLYPKKTFTFDVGKSLDRFLLPFLHHKCNKID